MIQVSMNLLLVIFCLSCNKNSSDSSKGSTLTSFMKPSSNSVKIIIDKVEMGLKLNEFKEKYKDRILACKDTFVERKGKENVPKEAVRVPIDYCTFKAEENESFEFQFDKDGNLFNAKRSYAKEIMGGIYTKSKGPALSFVISTFNERFDSTPTISKEETTISDAYELTQGNFGATISTLFYIVSYELSGQKSVYILSDYFNSSSDDKDNIKVLMIKYVNNQLQEKIDLSLKAKLDDAIRKRDENKI